MRSLTLYATTDLRRSRWHFVSQEECKPDLGHKKGLRPILAGVLNSVLLSLFG